MTTQPVKEFNSMTATHCFYTPGKPGIIDTLTRDKRGMFSGESVEEVRRRYPGAEIGLMDEVMSKQDSFWITEPTEITEERFDEMLSVLPPLNWRSEPNSESFKLQEFTSGMITGIFVRIGAKYYAMQNKATLKHAEIVKIVEDKLQNEMVSEAAKALDYLTEDELERGV